MEVSYIRQSAILDPEKAKKLHITIAGCGTVGSNAAIQLARAGFKNFHLIDMDKVEPHNLPSQSFHLADAYNDSFKSISLAARLDEIADSLSIKASTDELTGEELFNTDVFVCAVDSMKMRKLLFEANRLNPKVQLFIDTRMGGLNMTVFAFNPNDTKRIDQYNNTLYSDEDASELPCGTRTFSPIGALSGAVITQIVTRLVAGRGVPYMVQTDFDKFDFSVVGLQE